MGNLSSNDVILQYSFKLKWFCALRHIYIWMNKSRKLRWLAMGFMQQKWFCTQEYYKWGSNVSTTEFKRFTTNITFLDKMKSEFNNSSERNLDLQSHVSMTLQFHYRWDWLISKYCKQSTKLLNIFVCLWHMDHFLCLGRTIISLDSNLQVIFTIQFEMWFNTGLPLKCFMCLLTFKGVWVKTLKGTDQIGLNINLKWFLVPVYKIL